jgi:hypothetical protein
VFPSLNLVIVRTFGYLSTSCDTGSLTAIDLDRSFPIGYNCQPVTIIFCFVTSCRRGDGILKGADIPLAG